MAFCFGKSEQRVKVSNVAEQSMVKWPYKFLCLKLRGHLTESYKTISQCTEMIGDKCTEIKIVIYQSISKRQHAELMTIVKFQPSRSTIFTFYPTLTQKLLGRFSPSFFTHCRAIKGAINACIRKLMFYLVLECESKE